MNQSRSINCILVISHPRSGTHFTIDSIKNNVQGVLFHPLRFGTSPSPDQFLLSHDSDFLNQMHNYIFRNDSNISIVKTHMLPSEFKAAMSSKILSSSTRELIRYLYENAAKVYIQRDCRDVMVSYYNYMKNGGGLLFIGAKSRNQKASFSEFIRMSNDYVLPVRSYENYDQNRIIYWLHHIREWSSIEEVVHVNYDNLNREWERTVISIIDQLGLQSRLNKTIVRPVLNNSNIVSKLKRKVLSLFGTQYTRGSTAKLPMEGRSGSFKEYFNQADTDFIRDQIGIEAGPFGYTF